MRSFLLLSVTSELPFYIFFNKTKDFLQTYHTKKWQI